jgi:hypothetical protein
MCICGTLESAIHTSFILIPIFKFAISSLPDKSLMIATVFQFTGFAFYAYPNTLLSPYVKKEWLLFWMQSTYCVGSIIMLIIAAMWVPQYEESLRRSSASLFWKPQLEYISEDEKSRISEEEYA